MKILFRLVLITALTFSALKVNAAVLTTPEVKNIITKQVKEIYKNYTDAQIEVEVVALPFKDLYIPDGNVSFTVKPSMDKFLARDLEKVSVYVNDNFIKTFNAPVVVKAYENVLVASNFINIGQPITPMVASSKKLEISNILEYPLKADSLGKEMLAKKAFREGEILDKRFVKLKPDISRNSVVTVVFKTNNLTVSTDARALSDGIIGENICLMSKNYNKIYTGKVVGENKVLVEI